MGYSDKHESSQYKKPKHSKLGEIVDKRKLNDDEIREVQDSLDPFYWESYCGACDYFETDECPHKGYVDRITRWGIDVDCKKFMD